MSPSGLNFPSPSARIVALLHDVIITVGVFAICGHELSLIMVGAILTIAGYSINDTIVVYDRIREGLHSGRRGSIQEIMNASINETLSRTLLTCGCTLLSVLALFLFGGAVLQDFAFAILIGVVVGTYSSIFIASPIVLWWSGRSAAPACTPRSSASPSPGRPNRRDTGELLRRKGALTRSAAIAFGARRTRCYQPRYPSGPSMKSRPM